MKTLEIPRDSLVLAVTGVELSGKTALSHRLRSHIAHLGAGVSASLIEAKNYENNRQKDVIEAVLAGAANATVTIVDDLRRLEDAQALRKLIPGQLFFAHVDATDTVREARQRNRLAETFPTHARDALNPNFPVSMLEDGDEYLTSVIFGMANCPNRVLSNNDQAELSQNVSRIVTSLRAAVAA